MYSSFGFHQDGEGAVDVGVADDDGKFVGGGDDLCNVDVVPCQLLENVVVYAGAVGVFERQLDGDRRQTAAL